MKRLYIALVLMAAAVFICIFSNNSVQKSSSQLRDELNTVGSFIIKGETEKAKKSLESAESRHKKAEKLFSFIVDADKIEEMNVCFLMIGAHLDDGNNEHALERLRECVFLLEEISENEKLSIKNIM